MPLSKAGPSGWSLHEDVYAREPAGQTLEKHRMPDGPSDPETVAALIRDELDLDGNARQNLATFCTTYVSPAARELMRLSIDKNMIDKDEYPQTAEIEARCVRILADLWNAPSAETTLGCSTTGSSEAAMLGGLAFKWRWRKARAAAGKACDRPNLVCGPVQVCWHKFARYFDVELRELPILPGEAGMTAAQVADAVDENTIGVVATLGVTFTCIYEPVAAIAATLDRVEAERGHDIPIHVDGASGAFIAPFLHGDVVWDFRLPRVRSVNASGHKFGLAPLGVGWVVWRTAEDLPQELVFDVDYLGGEIPTFALNFSRPAGEIVAQYFEFLRLGREGYARVHGSCAASAQFLAGRLAATGHLDLLYGGEGGLPAVTYALRDADRRGYTLYDLSERLRMRGWQVAAYPLPANRHDTVVHRVLVRHGMGRDLMALFAEDVVRAIDHLDRNPVPRSSAGPSFHHGG